MTEARHAAARRVRLGIPHLAVRVLLDVDAVAAQLAELVEARPDRPVRELLWRKLMTGIAIGADGTLRIVRILHAAAFLRDLLAVLPVAHVLAVRGPLDRRHVRL